MAYYGFLGGVVRALVGLMKSKMFKRKFDAWYLVFTLIASGVIGAAAGLLVYGDYRLAILAGYAGTDFIEGVYRIRFKGDKK
ncbi:MAG: hypothetical protein ACE5FT_06825 [Candidatus Nanoarchaeia archaeon]